MGRADLRGAIWQRLREQVLATEDTCAICGQPVDKAIPYWSRQDDGTRRVNPQAASIDHVQPVSRGGDPWLRGNLQLVHAWCNTSKLDGRRRAPRREPSRRWLG